MTKIPAVITVHKHGINQTIHVEAFSTLLKAQAHFLILCAELKGKYDNEKEEWRFTIDDKIVYIQWINVR